MNPMAKVKNNNGAFKRGYDPRRHILTPAERVKGFWNAIYSIIIRHPGCVDAYGRHMACKFLRKRKEKAQ